MFLGGILHFLYQFNGKRNECSTEELQNLQLCPNCVSTNTTW